MHGTLPTHNQAPPQNFTPEVAGEFYLLTHGQTLEIRPTEPLMSLEESHSQGINGIVLAEMMLPSGVPQGSYLDKKIAIVDFGEDMPRGGTAVMFNPNRGVSVPEWGGTFHRFGLVGLNYNTANDGGIPFAPLEIGETVTIGRDPESDINRMLGISDSTDPKVSLKHATIHVREDGVIFLEDRSAHGTKAR
jgi:hypothetical protein